MIPDTVGRSPDTLRCTYLILFLSGLIALTGCATSSPKRLPAESDKRNEVVSHALSMLGKPYRYGGSTSNGFDCSGLVHYSYVHSGMRVPRSTKTQLSSSSAIKKKNIQPGDLLFFRISGFKVNHVGIYLGGNKFIHAPSTGKHVSIAKLNNPYWKKRLVDSRTFFK